MKIQRVLKNTIKESLGRGKVVVIYGARQVGKTTLVQEIQKELQGSYYLCENQDVMDALSAGTTTALKSFFGEQKLIILDEAQVVSNIGKKLKMLIDTYPEIKLLVTGSSSFELSNKIKEPLTGRKFEYFLYPISILELKNSYSPIELNRLLPRFLKYGLYPEILSLSDFEAQKRLSELSSSYLFKDVFNYLEIKNPEILRKLLLLLAFQIGSEVSFGELSNKLNVSIETVERYLQLLEQAFVVFRLTGFSRNLRNEVNKTRKIYFYDLGIRNALIENYNSIDLRPDIGALWENFCFIERIKSLAYKQQRVNRYFWRTYDQKEIDYIEEKDGKLNTFEFKWNTKKKTKTPKLFLETYKEYSPSFEVITPENWVGFVG